MCKKCNLTYPYKAMELEDAKADAIFLENQKKFRKERERYLDELQLRVQYLWKSPQTTQIR